jgi:Holliday junction resolvase YEN1
MRLWMPACMVNLVEPSLKEKFDEEVARKAAKKTGKGHGWGLKKKAEGGDDGDAPFSPAKAKPSQPRAAPARYFEDGDRTSAAPKGRSKGVTTAMSKVKGKTKVLEVLSSNEESEGELPSPSRLFPVVQRETSVSSKTTDIFSCAGGIDGILPSNIMSQLMQSESCKTYNNCTRVCSAIFTTVVVCYLGRAKAPVCAPINALSDTSCISVMYDRRS